MSGAGLVFLCGKMAAAGVWGWAAGPLWGFSSGTEKRRKCIWFAGKQVAWKTVTMC